MPCLVELIQCKHSLSNTNSTWAGLCHVATPFIAATELGTGRWQLTFDSLVFVFSLMLLPGLWYRHDCLVEKQAAVKSLVLLDFGALATSAKVSKSCCN